MKKIKCEKVIKLPDGLHSGKITGVEEIKTEQGYEYLDLWITDKETELKLRCGVPLRLTENTALYGLLKNFGVICQSGKEYDIESSLLNKEIHFMTMTTNTDRGNFTKVIPSSIKPI